MVCDGATDCAHTLWVNMGRWREKQAFTKEWVLLKWGVGGWVMDGIVQAKVVST